MLLSLSVNIACHKLKSCRIMTAMKVIISILMMAVAIIKIVKKMVMMTMIFF